MTARAQFASGVNLVEVYATVTDSHGEPVTGLTARDFQISEDGEPQPISVFAADGVPLAVALAIDRSFSMSGEPLVRAKTAARAFFAALGPSDRAMLIAIGSETGVRVPLTSDRAALSDALDRLDAWGTTPLYDAAASAIDAVQAAAGRRALVLLSDGVDRYSRTAAGVLLERARRSDVLLYPVALGRTRPPLFAELAAATGGRSFFVSDSRQLAPALEAIARELRLQYLLGYTPRRERAEVGAGAPAWHAIDVTVTRPGWRVRARDGYVSR